MRSGCLFAFLFLLVLSGHTMASAIPSDTGPVQLRHFNKQALEQYKTQSDFKYETAKPEEFSLWGWIEYLVAKLFNKIFSAHQQASILKILFYGLMVFAAIVIILNLLGVDMRSFFTGNSRQVMSYQLAEEGVRELNLDQLISEALSNRQWRLAIRYHYLKALRLLTDKELIDWKADKTNMDYYYELKGGNLRDVFLEITGVFENAWYGHHDLTLADYNNFSGGFEQFYVQIKSYRS